MNEKKKVLIVNEPLDMGGMDIAAIRLEKNLDKDKFECTYCVRRTRQGPLEQGLLDRGIRVIHVPDGELGYYKSYKFYKKLFQEEHFDIVHCHLPFFSGLVFYAAKKSGSPNCVAHGHFTSPYNDAADISLKRRIIGSIYRMFMRGVLKKYCDKKVACSENAGNYLFGEKEFKKNGIILNNGVDTTKYIYDENIRKSVRKDLGIPDNAVVLGHIGLMNGVKNQGFVIDVFNKYYKSNPNSYLLLIGIGPDLEKFKIKAKSFPCSNNVFFLGERRDVSDLLQAMDCFVFPSVHEGFPLTLIEAQAAKLPCVVSDTVTKTTKLNHNVSFVSINDNPNVWCNEIIHLLSFERISVDNTDVIKNYDIRNIAKSLEKIYLS